MAAHKVIVNGLTVEQVINAITLAETSANRAYNNSLKQHGEKSPITIGFKDLASELKTATVDPA